MVGRFVSSSSLCCLFFVFVCFVFFCFLLFRFVFCFVCFVCFVFSSDLMLYSFLSFYQNNIAEYINNQLQAVQGQRAMTELRSRVIGIKVLAFLF